MNPKTNFHQFSRQERYRAFEVLLRWEGRCNASDLGALFDVRRENVSRDLRAYRSLYPANVIYDGVLKSYRPAALFTPRVTDGVIAEYMELLRRHSPALFQLSRSSTWIERGPQPFVEPLPELFAAVVQAIRERRPVRVTYRSWNKPQGIVRVIHPHGIAYSGLRWHCRAFDEETDSYRDFHLGRFGKWRFVDDDKAYVPGEADTDWHTVSEIALVPNPRLPEPEQAFVAADYGMRAGQLILRCRESMRLYLLQAYQVEMEGETVENPRARPLVLVQDRHQKKKGPS